MSLEKITELVNVIYPAMVVNIDKAIIQLNLTKQELINQKNAIIFVQNEMANNSISILNTKGYDAIGYGVAWNVSNLSDFAGANYLMNATASGNHSFYVTGSAALGGNKVVCNCGVNGFILRTVIDVLYDEVSNTTTYNLDTNEQSIAGLISIYRVFYLYGGVGWDNDFDIIFNNNAFIEAYNQIHDLMGLDGTYGLNDRIDKIDLAIDIQEKDKEKYETYISTYSQFI